MVKGKVTLLSYVAKRWKGVKKFEKRRICRENEFMRDQTRVSKRMIELKSKKNM